MTKSVTIYSPVTGTAAELSETPDEAFAVSSDGRILRDEVMRV